MSQITYFVVVPFVRERGVLMAGEAIEARDDAAARRIAARFAASGAGAVAFSRQADMEAGQYDAAVVIAELGEVPQDWAAMME